MIRRLFDIVFTAMERAMDKDGLLGRLCYIILFLGAAAYAIGWLIRGLFK